MPDNFLDDFKVDKVDDNAQKDAELLKKEAKEHKEDAKVTDELIDDKGTAEPGKLTDELTDDDTAKKADESVKLTDEQQKDLVKANYQLLVQQGVLPEGLEVNTWEDLANQTSDLKLAGINEFIEELPVELQDTVKAWQQGLDYNQAQQRRQNVVQYKQITDDRLKDEKTALQVIKNYHKQLGDSDDYIKARIDNIVDTDSSFLEAKRARDAMVRIQEDVAKREKEIELAQHNEQVKRAEEYKKSMESKVKAPDTFWGKKLSTVDQQEVIDAIFNPEVIKRKHKDFKTLEEAISKDPVIYAQIYYAYIKGMFGEKGNLKFIGNTVKSNATQSIDRVLKGLSATTIRPDASDTQTKKGMGFLDTIKQNLRP